LKIAITTFFTNFMNYKKVILTQILYSSLLIVAGAQRSKIDSLLTVLKTEKEDTNKVNTLDALSDKLDRDAQYKSSDSAGRAALQLAEKLNYKQGQAIAYHSIGYANFNMGNYDESLNDYMLAVRLDEETTNKPALGKVNCDIGSIYRKKGDYPMR
jgi:tetratricopeptide (TPR) repeat protein